MNERCNFLKPHLTGTLGLQLLSQSGQFVVIGGPTINAQIAPNDSSTARCYLGFLQVILQMEHSSGLSLGHRTTPAFNQYGLAAS